VIEDCFAAARPRWEEAGAQLVDDVAPFELMKLRLLNGAHSTLAYLGYLTGHDYIYQVSAEPAYQRLLRALWAELAPTLPALPGVDLPAYQEQLLARFQNSALPHRTWQIAMDGSQKLPQRLLNAARERLAHGFCVDAIALAVAGWMRYVSGVDERGNPIDVRDPLAADYAAIAARAQGNPRALAEGLFGLRAVFGEELAANQKFRTRVTNHLQDLHSAGGAATVAHLYPA
jgi:fructuronate reductase